MRILVYGAGAVGGYLGAGLSRGGHNVTLITRQFTAETINANGLSLAEEGQIVKVRPLAVPSIPHAFPENGTPYDLIIMSMKSYDLVPALDPLIAFCPSPPPIITVQNGIGVEQPLITQFGAERIIAGSLTTPIRKETLNSLLVARGDRGLGLAPTQPGQNITKWVNLFQNAGIETVAIADYRAMKWSKALLNIVGNATSAILNRTPGVIYKSPALFDLEVRMLREALTVMEKQNLELIDLPGSPTSRLATGVKRMPRALLKPIMTNIVAKGRGSKMPSFHIDLSSGKKRSEVEYHNGAIAQAGQALRIPTPVNFVLNDLLLKLTREELDWREFDGRPKKLMAALKQHEQRTRR